MTQKNLLFITPVFPSLKGRGRNFRAFQWVWRLQKKFHVSVLCTSVYGKHLYKDTENIKNLDCKIFSFNHKYSKLKRIKNLFSLRPSTWNAIGDVTQKKVQELNIPKPDVILCFRIENASTVLHLNNYWKKADIWLDIDELDSRVKFSIAKLMKNDGYYFSAIKTWIEAFLFSVQEARLIPEFEVVFTSTETEKKYIHSYNFPVQIKVFKNMLPRSKNEALQASQNNPFSFMFVGDSNYFPNRDAIGEILFKMIPGLKKVTQVPFTFIIIGGDIGMREQRQIDEYECVEFYHDADDLKSIYDSSNAVVVPLRKGGGSSLKFLEALSFKKPVITTVVGARGFDIKHGTHALIARNTDEMVDYCNTLMTDTRLAEELSSNGYQWFVKNNSFTIESAKNIEDIEEF